tara:strand:+ start:891 stop:1682 length:792 start_codon:yes stop_codon:yes gene_type:complete
MSIHTTSCENSFRQILWKFEEGKNFTYARFGDGDLFMMFDKHQEDSQKDGTVGKWNRFVVTPKLQEELKDSFNIIDDNYMVATVMNQSNNEIDMVGCNDRLVNHYNESVSNGELVHRDWFHHHFVFIHSFANYFNGPWGHHDLGFSEMIEKFIKPKRVMYVSGYISDGFKKLFGDVKHFVETPKQNSYENIDDWYPELLEKSFDTDVVLLATGFSSRVVTKRLWNDNKNLQVLDLGSIVDGLRSSYNRLWLQRYKDTFEKFND